MQNLVPAQYRICWIKSIATNIKIASPSCITVSANLLQQSGENFSLRHRFAELLYGETYQFYIHSVDVFYDISSPSNIAKVKLYHLSRPTDAEVIVLSHKERRVGISWKILLNDPKMTTGMFYVAFFLILENYQFTICFYIEVR